MNLMDVLVVEDSPEFAQIVATVLRQQGHRVRTAASIEAANESIGAVPPDLVVLDLNLPDGDGLDLCRSIRDRSSAYIVVLSGRDDEVDKVVGFRLGADDYVTKPFSPREFGARVEAMARRPRRAPALPTELIDGDVVVQPMARVVTVDGFEVDLTRIEFDLLEQFVGHPQQVFTRGQLLERVWGENWYGDDHVVDVHIANLRKKLAAHTERSVVRTVRGVGYGLATAA